MQSEILKPIVVLAAWSMVMLGWLVVVRLPALRKAGIDLSKVRGSRPGGLDTVLPPEAQWPAHNYIHLMEQPTVFYAVAVALAVAGAGNGLSATLAWIYVGLRILHSIVQATVNRIAFRFALFAISSTVLICLILLALTVVF